MKAWLEEAGLRVENVVDLKGDKVKASALTVTLWLARDPDLLMASALNENTDRRA
jgi:ArsR family transcriptional regulator